MTDKQPTQGMADDGRKGAADGTNRPGEARSGGGDSGGGAFPRPHATKSSGKSFAGGQSEKAYHGTGQLGDEKVGDRTNRNAPARSE